jgi:hypothetical protein
MQVRSEQKAVGDLVHTALSVRDDVRGFEHWQRVFVCHGARTFVRIGDRNSECALPKPRPHQHWFAVPSVFLADDQIVTG